MIANKWLGALTTLFLGTTLATSATGFLFHSPKFGPPHIIGLLSLAVLAAALFALYARHLAGPWRTLYIVCAVFALYLNSFVGVVQAFQKIPAIHELAPTQSEPPFKIAQALVLVAFVVAGYLSVKRFHPGR
jgi:glucan phosphoethanolaminetransferase (alkaline phosphatase superfamily)